MLFRLLPTIDSYKRKMIAKDYETKVPEEVRIANQEKVNAYQTEYDETIRAMKMFESMK